MDEEIIKVAQKFTQVSSHLSQVPSNKELVNLVSSADDHLLKFLEKRVHKDKNVAEFVRAIFLGKCKQITSN